MTVPTHARAHVTDLLDSVIEQMIQMARRFSSLDPDPGTALLAFDTVQLVWGVLTSVHGS